MSLDPKIAQACFTRDGWKCRNPGCQSRNNLHPHHFIYKSHGGTDNLNNLLTLCASCHRGHHDGHLHIEFANRTHYDVIVRFTRNKGWKPT